MVFSVNFDNKTRELVMVRVTAKYIGVGCLYLITFVMADGSLSCVCAQTSSHPKQIAFKGYYIPKRSTLIKSPWVCNVRILFPRTSFRWYFFQGRTKYKISNKIGRD